MQWNAYLADALAWLIVVIPATLIALKLGYQKIRWWMIFVATLLLSWIVSVGYFQAFPPNMGFGAVLAWMFGWATMLPLLGVFSIVWNAKRWRGTTLARLLVVLLAVIALALPITACFRWLPEEAAKTIAREELMRNGYTEFEVGDAKRTWDGWTVYAELPNGQRYPVYLSRSGFCSGMGG